MLTTSATDPCLVAAIRFVEERTNVSPACSTANASIRVPFDRCSTTKSFRSLLKKTKAHRPSPTAGFFSRRAITSDTVDPMVPALVPAMLACCCGRSWESSTPQSFRAAHRPTTKRLEREPVFVCQLSSQSPAVRSTTRRPRARSTSSIGVRNGSRSATIMTELGSRASSNTDGSFDTTNSKSCLRSVIASTRN